MESVQTPMTNPNGPYPGRQLFLGLTSDKKPCLVYLVTGRSPESRQRKAVQFENTVRIGPVEQVAYDPLRHYTALKYDDSSGIAAVSNGIQTEAVYEIYRLLFNVDSVPGTEYMEKLLDGANAEPDSLYTPRIAGALIPARGNPIAFVGITTYDLRSVARQFAPRPGHLFGVSTYRGSLDDPEPRDPRSALTKLEFEGKTAGELANQLYETSATDYKGDDIRVCAVAAVYSGKAWELAIINKHK